MRLTSCHLLTLLVCLLFACSTHQQIAPQSNDAIPNTQPDPTAIPGTYPMPADQVNEFSKVVEHVHELSPDAFPDRPLQLVRPDHEHKKLVIVEENLKFLYNIHMPVSTISVVGKFHSGKSFLMNQIMAKSGGFGIGSKVTPETMGIWVWGQPIKVTSSSSSNPAQWILLLDTEGFAATNVSENYDAKIFAVSTLLSSQLLYNSVKIIDQSDIDYLELLARRTQLFALKAQMTPQNWSGNDFSPQLLDFPSLIWVIQDFVQETDDENCRDWLLRLLSTHTRETESYEISLKDIFPSVDCHTLFIPSMKKKYLTDLSQATEADLTSEYRQERDALLAKVKSVTPKIKNDKPFTGTELVMLLRILVNAANEGSLTNIPNRWDAFLDSLQKSAVEDCFKFYQVNMNDLLVAQAKNEAVNCDRLDSWHNISQAKAFNLLTHLLQGLSKSLTASKPELNDLISKYYFSVAELNRQKIHVKLFNIQKSFELKVVDKFLVVQLPTLSSKLHALAQSTDAIFANEFTLEVGDLVPRSNLTSNLNALNKAIKLNLDSALLRNGQKLDLFFENVTRSVLDESFSEVQINFVNPLSHKAFETVLKQSFDRSVDAFVRRSAQFADEKPLLEDKLFKVKAKLMEKATILREDNEQAVASFLGEEMHKFVYEFERLTSGVKKDFPMDFEKLNGLLKHELGKLQSSFVADMATYQDYHKVYSEAQEKFKAELVKIAEKRTAENFQAYKLEVETPLKLAKKTVLLSGSLYTTQFSFKRFVVSSCMLLLDDGKAKNWPDRLKAEIIESFMREDEQLNYELQSRAGVWSRIIGFFQWLFSIFFG